MGVASGEGRNTRLTQPWHGGRAVPRLCQPCFWVADYLFAASNYSFEPCTSGFMAVLPLLQSAGQTSPLFS